MKLEERIVEIAKSYIGQEELPNNSGFIQSDYEEKIKSIGWVKGQSWCTHAVELVWTEAFSEIDPDGIPLLKMLFSGYAIKTLENFTNSGVFEVGQVPNIGAIAIWQHGNTEMGHAGVVVSFTRTTFKSCEGNTHREGEYEAKEYAERLRRLNIPHTSDGLNLLGFIYPQRKK